MSQCGSLDNPATRVTAAQEKPKQRGVPIFVPRNATPPPRSSFDSSRVVEVLGSLPSDKKEGKGKNKKRNNNSIKAITPKTEDEDPIRQDDDAWRRMECQSSTSSGSVAPPSGKTRDTEEPIIKIVKQTVSDQLSVPMDSTNDKENDKTTILDTQFTQEETQMLAGPSQTKPAGRHEPREPRTLPLTFYWMSRDNGPPLRDAVLKLTDQHFLILVEGHGMERFDLSRVRDIAYLQDLTRPLFVFTSISSKPVKPYSVICLAQRSTHLKEFVRIVRSRCRKLRIMSKLEILGARSLLQDSLSDDALSPLPRPVPDTSTVPSSFKDVE